MGAQDFRSAKALFVPLLKRDIVLAVARHDPGGRIAIPRWMARIHLTISGAMAAWPLTACARQSAVPVIAPHWLQSIGTAGRDSSE